MAFFIQHRLRYLALKARDSLSINFGIYDGGQISTKELLSRLWKDISEERMTMVRCVEGEEMEPTFATRERLLVRKIPFPSNGSLFVGDAVLLKDPSDSSVERVSRIAAVEGDEMVSINENDKPFELEKGECWVLCDNDTMKPKEGQDSRSFGPLSMQNILGRVLYGVRSSSDHGQVRNSAMAMYADSPVLAVELDLEELSSDEQK